MNSSQIHLALTHVPVILSVVGLVMLVIAMFKKNDTLVKTAFYVLFLAGVFAVPVFFTGEGVEETVEQLPGVTASVIERHEDLAKLAFGIVTTAAIGSLIALVFYRQTAIRKWIGPLVLFVAFLSAGVMAVTAHWGGQVRHTEIRSGGASPGGGTNYNMQKNSNEDND